MALATNALASQGLEGTQWGSDYVTDKVRYTLSFTAENKVIVQSDPNKCDIGELGQILGCTKRVVNFTTYSMQVAPINTNRRTLAYDLVPISPTASNKKLRLVTNFPLNQLNLEALRLVVFDLQGYGEETIRLLKK